MANKREIPNDQVFYRELTFKRDSINVEARSVEVSFSSETDTVIRWGEPEILDHAPGCANLTRINSIGVVLFNHDPNQPIGKPVNARIENSRGVATLIFDSDEESDRIFQKVVSGTLRGISISYTYDDYTFLGTNETSADGRFQGPCLLVKKWTVLEISVVSIPADATVGIGRSLEDMLTPLIEKMISERLVKLQTRGQSKGDDQDNQDETDDSACEEEEERSIEPYLRKLRMYEKAV